jgi:hypothetical protein
VDPEDPDEFIKAPLGVKEILNVVEDALRT